MRKFINGYEGLYEIDILGNIYTHYLKSKKIMKCGTMTSGYKMVSLKKDGIAKCYSVHRLLALHFIPNPDNKSQVNHKDGNKLNNDINNLEWVTPGENNKHAYDNGLKKYRPLHYKGKFGIEHNRSKQVVCKETGISYGSQSEAGRLLNISHTSVSWSIRNKKPIYGMHFEIKE